MSQLLIALATRVSVIPDAAKSAVFVLCELFVLAVVLSPFLLTEKPEADGSASRTPMRGSEKA